MVYLIMPGDIIVKPKPELTVYMAMTRVTPYGIKAKGPDPIQKGNRVVTKTASWSITAWRWVLVAGRLSRRTELLTLETPHKSGIADLEWYPLTFAPSEIKTILSTRGHNFWRCRGRQLVGYSSKPKP